MHSTTAGGIAALLERAIINGAARRAYTNLVDGRDEGRVLSYAQLYQAAGEGASVLRATLAPGQRVLILQDDTLDFLICFLACLFARVIAVPIPPPDATRVKRSLPRVQAVAADCGAVAVLASVHIRDQMNQAFADVDSMAALPWLVVEQFAGAAVSAPLPVDDDEVAYLQYSSGSTASPKGVMMTHANLLDNLARLQRDMHYDASAITVSWMPYFHDYGLVDGLLQPLYSQIPCYVMSPVAFIKRPWRWLEAVSRFRATHMHGPNFAYQMCLDRVSDDKLDGLDLSCVRLAGCGAEPVRRATVEPFLARYAACGFAPGAFAPAYGLAEATLMVTVKVPGTDYRTVYLQHEESAGKRCIDVAPDHPRARAVISCGRAPQDAGVFIVDPASGDELPDDTTGEIWIANPGVSPGYWNRAEETSAAFQAYTRQGRGPMLRSADLGFLRDQELYVTGRIKDLIIIHGTNHYPQDIEQTVETVGDWLRATFVVAFAVEHAGQERLVVAAELNGRMTPEQAQPRMAALRAAVSLRHEIACAGIVLLPRGSLPKTSSGKIQRNACRDAYLGGDWSPIAQWREGPAQDAGANVGANINVNVSAGEQCELLVRQVVAQRKGLVPDAVGPLEPFANLGISSIEAVEIAALLEERSGCTLAATLLWEYPHARALAAMLATLMTGAAGRAAPAPVAGAAAHDADGIAIIGMACRFPGGADTTAAFWELLNSGATAIGAAPAQRFADPQPRAHAGFVEALFDFDAAFFGVADAEAHSMDPQQRQVLGCAWHALENAGIVPAALAGSDTGVYIGVSGTEYAHQIMAAAGAAGRHGPTGSSAAIIANRLSYFLDLRGPSLVTDTACSASLVAVHQACQALRAGECTLALAGGVNALLNAELIEMLRQADMLSDSDSCRPFDAAADGYVRGEGCGMVVLKPLAAARRDGDQVLAVIRGSALAQDGRSNGLTAPNGAAQRQLIVKALARSGLAPAQIGYIEAHGTGTPLGDPIELRALADCYGAPGASGAPEVPCYVGAVKGVIGHLEGAAGIAGLIKAVLVLGHGVIPANPMLKNINPHADPGATRLVLTAASRLWQTAGPRYAGVSAFGFGGTLAHVVLEGPAPAPPALASAPDADGALLLLSARDQDALARLAARYAIVVARAEAGALAALCAGAARRRTLFPVRAGFAAADAAGLAAALHAFQPTQPAATGAPPIAFVFTGQGAQREAMGAALYQRYPDFRVAIDSYDAMVQAELGMPARQLLCGLSAQELMRTALAQPALLLLQLGLLRLWDAFGVRPGVVLGHSVGEFGAAVAAGVMSGHDAMRLVLARAQLMEQCAPGAMAALQVSATAAQALIAECGGALTLAVHNGPQRVVLAGAPEAIEALLSLCATRAIAALRLPVNRAFHSAAMGPARARFAALLAQVSLRAPVLTMLSSLTAARAGAELASVDYWLRQMSEAVDFAGAAALLPDTGAGLVIEIGPSNVLCTLGPACLADDAGARAPWLASLSAHGPEHQALLATLALLHAQQVPLRLAPVFDGVVAAHGAGLPLYPFAQRSYRLRPERLPNPASQHLPESAGAVYLNQWLALPGAAAQGGARRACILIGARNDEQGERLHVALRASPHLELERTLAWEALATIEVGDNAPLLLLVCQADPGEAPPQAALRLGEQLLAGLRRLRERASRCQVWVLTRGAAPQGADEVMRIEAACVWGAGRVAALELPNMWGGMIDLADAATVAELASLGALLTNPGGEDQLALRGGVCFAARVVAAPLPPAPTPVLRADAVYWVLGGGALGQHALRALRAAGACHLVVSGRQQSASTELAQLGAHYLQADIGNPADLERVLAHIDARGMPLAGIVHAAGSATEYTIEHLTPERFRAVAQAKVEGAWHLHRLTETRQLDMFVCFASIAGLWGSAGQAHYAAANHFLDLLCQARQRAGLAALALDWGPWSGGGLVDASAQRRLSEAGLTLLSPERGRALFLAALGSGLARVGLADVRWAEFGALFGARRSSPLLAQMIGAPAPAPVQAAAGAPGRLQGTPASVRAHIAQRLLACLAAQLGPGRQLDAARGFFDLGLDSLAMVAMHQRLSNELGIDFQRADMFNYPNADALGERLWQLWAERQAPPPDQAASELSSAEIAARIDAEMVALGLSG